MKPARKTAVLHVRITAQLNRRIRRVCKAKHFKIVSFVEATLEEQLRHWEPKG